MDNATDFFWSARYTEPIEWGCEMQVYLDVIMLLNFSVDFLLLAGTNRIAGFPQRWGKQLLAAVLGAIYGGACLLPGFYFLGNVFWRIMILAMMGMLCFGFCLGAVRRTVLFVILCFALGGIASAWERSDFYAIIFAAAGICVCCVFGFRGNAGVEKMVPIELFHNRKHVSILAMRDTGNTLCDPVTGQSVIVTSAEVGMELLGLTVEQLASPVETVAMGIIPGLRLLPFRTVGQVSGFLITAKLDKVVVGKQESGQLVAFSAQKLDREGTYQALMGGV